MREQIVAVITSRGSDREARSLWARVESAWPAFARRPAVRFASFEEAAREQAASCAACALLAPGDAAPSAHFHAVVDALASELTGAALLAPPDWDPRVASQRDGALVTMPADADPAIIAAAIFALLGRQRAVSGVSRELSMLRRFQGGLRSEMGRIHDELQLASRVQQQILPTELPQIPPIAVDALFRPCGYVSGDIYDVAALDEHRVGFFLADAMGHGVPAALMTMIISRALPWSDGAPEFAAPARALSRLNDALKSSLGSSVRFATAVYGVADARTGRIRLAGAGHPPPLLFRAGESEPEPLETAGPLLGVFPDAEFTEIERDLEEGDVLIIHSDGVEMIAEKEHKGDAPKPGDAVASAWRDLARESQAHGLSAGIDALAALLDRQSGSFHQRDDVTALAFHMTEPAVRSSGGAGAQPHTIGKAHD